MKKTPPPVPTYIFNNNDDINQYNAKKRIVKLFLLNPQSTYRTQSQIASALKELNTSLTQSAVSKALKVLLNKKFKYRDSLYTITKFEGAYLLQNTQEHEESLQSEMKRQGLFKRELVYYEKGLRHPQTFIFWINEKGDRPEKVLQYFQDFLFGDYLDLFLHGDKLIIMLDPTSPNFVLRSDILRNFFTPNYDAYKKIPMK